MFKPTFELTNKQIAPEVFLESELANGISLDNDSFLGLARTAVEQLRNYSIKTILDFGAGVGAYTKAALDNYYEVYTYEIWDAHKNYMKSKMPNVNIVEEPVQTDAMLFIETAEHMTDEELHSLFKKIQPKYILFSSTSATTDFDIEWGHINIKQQDEWVTFFSNLGYRLEKELGQPTSWSKLFIK